MAVFYVIISIIAKQIKIQEAVPFTLCCAAAMLCKKNSSDIFRRIFLSGHFMAVFFMILFKIEDLPE